MSRRGTHRQASVHETRPVGAASIAARIQISKEFQRSGCLVTSPVTIFVRNA
jgi:hypothetical protein